MYIVPELHTNTAQLLACPVTTVAFLQRCELISALPKKEGTEAYKVATSMNACQCGVSVSMPTWRVCVALWHVCVPRCSSPAHVCADVSSSRMCVQWCVILWGVCSLMCYPLGCVYTHYTDVLSLACVCWYVLPHCRRAILHCVCVGWCVIPNVCQCVLPQHLCVGWRVIL